MLGDMNAAIGRLVVLAPMPSELAPVVKSLQLRRDVDGVHRGTVGRLEVVALRTGMGLGRATAATTRALDAHRPEHVVVVGIAGGIGPTPVGAVVCPEIVIHGESGVRYSAHALDGADGVISSSDDFVVDAVAIDRLTAAGVRAVDMETAAVAAVCVQRGVPWSAVRVISDRAADHPDAAVLGLANPDGSPNPRAALAFMVRNPRRVPQLVRLGRDAQRAARVAAAELRRQLEAVAAG